jgi:hypothetical protein
MLGRSGAAKADLKEREIGLANVMRNTIADYGEQDAPIWKTGTHRQVVPKFYLSHIPAQAFLAVIYMAQMYVI